MYKRVGMLVAYFVVAVALGCGGGGGGGGVTAGEGGGASGDDSSGGNGSGGGAGNGGGGELGTPGVSVVSTSPAADANGVDGCGLISATFSSPMDNQTFAAGFTLKTSGGSSVQGGVSGSADRKTATFTPLAPLTAGIQYIATVSTQTRDASGASLPSEKTWAFTAAPCANGATTYYVATTGSDSNTGTEASPFRTLAKAVASVSPGDLIRVRAGTYDRVQIGSRKGRADAWIRMRPYGDGPVVIRGNTTHSSVYFYTSACDEYSTVPCEPVYWILEGLTIQGSATGTGDGNAIKIDTPSVKLINNKLCCSYADVVKLVRTANDVQLLGNEIWQDGTITAPGRNAQGIDIVGADDVHVAFNHVRDIFTNYLAGDDPGGIGMYAKGNSRRTIFENNRIVNTDSHAMMLGQSTDSSRLVDGNYETYDGIMRNNVVINADWGCFATSSSYNVKIYNNSCYNVARVSSYAVLISNESEVNQTAVNVQIKNNIIVGSSANNRPLIGLSADALTTAADLVMSNNIYWSTGGISAVRFRHAYSYSVDFTTWKSLSGTDSNSRVVDPAYASLTDLKLSGASPAIDAGSNFPGVIAIDFFGTSRPRGAGTDIGAHEY